ncbi:uncharacterized protein SPSC_00121 [Sporisorium scitamineum]|uniref:Uncharacterized protein n=1 Tax=Sporisorium scitamineum TaxID=49012 RepID=A0A0F7SBW0_9BASI|nr:uncharacterized protein SPSC_00121 [Sporisorium scitamineum]CDW98565.1 hypothetical protein [Sporisorium scitamineum]
MSTLRQAAARDSPYVVASASSSRSPPPPRRSSGAISSGSIAPPQDITARNVPFSSPPRSFSDPLTVTPHAGSQVTSQVQAQCDVERKTIASEGRVPYGPGFYIPPPGYQSSSLGGCCDQRAGSGGRTAGIERPDPPELAFGCASLTKARRHEAGRTDRKLARRSRHKLPDTSGASSCGTFFTWAVLSILFVAAQMSLLARYDPKNGSAASIGLIWAAIFFELYAAMVSAIGLLTSMVLPSFSKVSDGIKQVRTRTLLDTLPTVCTIAVCLGAALQVVSLAVYALQSAEKSITYSVVTALTTSLIVTVASIGWNLHLDGHLRRTSRRSGSGSANTPHLPVANPGAPSRQPSSSSSVSSHGGKYVPDYGLDSDSESADDASGCKRPRPDWMDRVLDRVVRSPLLDMPGLQR